MESTGIVFKVLPPVTGTSERTGNPWMAQSFVLEVSSGDHGQYKDKQVFEIFGEDKIQQFKLREGMTCRVFFDLKAREHEGKWYNSAKVYNVVEIVPQQVQPQAAPQYGQQPQQAYRPQPQQQAYRPQQQQPPQNGYFQPVQQGYPQQNGYYQPVQQPPQQQQFPPQTDPVTGDPLPF